MDADESIQGAKVECPNCGKTLTIPTAGWHQIDWVPQGPSSIDKSLVWTSPEDRPPSSFLRKTLVVALCLTSAALLIVTGMWLGSFGGGPRNQPLAGAAASKPPISGKVDLPTTTDPRSHGDGLGNVPVEPSESSEPMQPGGAGSAAIPGESAKPLAAVRPATSPVAGADKGSASSEGKVEDMSQPATEPSETKNNAGTPTSPDKSAQLVPGGSVGNSGSTVPPVGKALAVWTSDWTAFVEELTKLVAKDNYYVNNVNSVFLGKKVVWTGTVTEIKRSSLIRLSMAPATLGRDRLDSLSLQPQDWVSWNNVSVGDKVVFSTTLDGGEFAPKCVLMKLIGQGVKSGNNLLWINTKGGDCLRKSPQRVESDQESTAPLQSWIASDGRVIQARFLKLDGEAVLIEKNGEQFSVPFAKLSAQSVEQAKAMGTQTVIPLQKSPAAMPPQPAGDKSKSPAGTHARLGETLEQCRNRYGDFTKELEKDGLKSYIFEKDGTSVLCGFLGDKCQYIVYTFKEDRHKGEAFVLKLLQYNIASGVWTLPPSKIDTSRATTSYVLRPCLHNSSLFLGRFMEIQDRGSSPYCQSLTVCTKEAAKVVDAAKKNEREKRQ